jgi:putative hemolysin
LDPASTNRDRLDLLALILLFFALFVFASLADCAIRSLTRAKLKRLSERSSSAAARIQQVVDRPDEFLASAALLKLASLLAATVIGTAVLGEARPDLPVWAVWMIVVVIATIAGWIVPRAVAARWSERIALAVLGPLQILTLLISPVGTVVVVATSKLSRLLGAREDPEGQLVTSDELKEMVAASEEEGFIEERERTMIDNILSLEDVSVREIMVPRPDIVAVSTTATVREAVDTFSREGYSRLPVYGETIDDIVGILYGKDLFSLLLGGRLTDTVGGFARPVYFVPESKKSDDLLRELQIQRVHIAVVVDEYGGTAGLVTIEDLLEEIVGEIQDEFDTEEQKIVTDGDDAALVDGSASIDDVNEVLGLKLTTEEVDSVGGFIYEKLGRVPIVGDTVEVEGATLTVIAAHRRRVTRVRIKRVTDKAEVATIADGSVTENPGDA